MAIIDQMSFHRLIVQLSFLDLDTAISSLVNGILLGKTWSHKQDRTGTVTVLVLKAGRV